MKGEAAQECHLEGEGRNKSPKKTSVRIVNITNEKAHNNRGGSIDNDTVCNKGSDALGRTGPGREQSYQAGFIHGFIARDTIEHLRAKSYFLWIASRLSQRRTGLDLRNPRLHSQYNCK